MMNNKSPVGKMITLSSGETFPGNHPVPDRSDQRINLGTRMERLDGGQENQRTERFGEQPGI